MNRGGLRRYKNEIDRYIMEEMKAVSYKWVSRKFGVSSNTAKIILEEYTKENSETVEALFVICGWNAENSEEFLIKLVPPLSLESELSKLQDPQSHLYSIQRKIPLDTALIWNEEFIQTELLSKEPLECGNCLRDNRFSAVRFPAMRRKSESRESRFPVPKKEETAGITLRNQGLRREVVPDLLIHRSTKTEDGKPPCKQPSNKEKAAIAEFSALNTVEKDKQPVDANKTMEMGSRDAATAPRGGTGSKSQSLTKLWHKTPVENLNLSSGRVNKPGRMAENTNNRAHEVQILESEDENDDDLSNFKLLREGNMPKRAVRKLQILDDENEDDGVEDAALVGEATVAELANDTVSNAMEAGTRQREEGLSVGERGGDDVQTNEVHLPKGTADGGAEYGAGDQGNMTAVGSVKPSSSKRKKRIVTTVDARGKEVTTIEFVDDKDGSEDQSDRRPRNQPEGGVNRKLGVVEALKGSSKDSKGKGKVANKGKGNIMSFFSRK